MKWRSEGYREVKKYSEEHERAEEIVAEKYTGIILPNGNLNPSQYDRRLGSIFQDKGEGEKRRDKRILFWHIFRGWFSIFSRFFFFLSFPPNYFSTSNFFIPSFFFLSELWTRITMLNMDFGFCGVSQIYHTVSGRGEKVTGWWKNPSYRNFTKIKAGCCKLQYYITGAFDECSTEQRITGEAQKKAENLTKGETSKKEKKKKKHSLLSM